MSSTSPPPGSAPSPTSPPSPPTVAPAPSSNATAAPPTTPAAPPPSSNATAPPLATSSAPPPAGPAMPTSSPPPAASPPAPSTPSPPSSSPTPDSNSPPSPPSPPAPAGRSGPSTPSLPLRKAPPASRGVSVSPSSSSSSSSVSTSLVVGVAVGAAVILLLFTILCFCCRRKKRRSPPPLDYYGGLPPPPPQPWKDNPYGGQAQNWEYNAPPPGGHVVKLPVQPTPPPPFPSRPPYPPQLSSSFETPHPPPPPPIISSSGGSGSNYSGSETLLPPPSPGLTLGFSKSAFTYEELVIATNGFSDDNLLGQGGFGHVHKGRLPNGKEVAIKRLKSGSRQGEREFQAEVEIISRVHHKHLVSLVGYCISGGQRLLVYEYVSNKTLEFHLHGKDRLTMDWATRLKIALGSAKGLAYLHEDCHPKIIHRDIKAANILLDYRFEAKVADFGLAKFASDENTHVSTRVMGTFGYLAPEYALSGKLTDKSDVFSFGVMLLEIITGRRPVDTTQSFMDDSLVDWARPLLTCALDEGNYDALIDPRMGKYYNPNEMACMIACAAACIRHSARQRPRMSQIVRALEGNASLEDLNEGARPGHSTLHGSYGSTDYDSGHYNEDMKRFRKMALASQNYTASGYSEPTSEYGQIPSASSSEGQLTREMEIGWRKRDSQGLSNSS